MLLIWASQQWGEPAPPPTEDVRVTEEGDRRVTETGDVRITEDG